MVQSKQAGNTITASHCWDQSRRPVITVNQIRLDPWNNMLDYLPLKGQGNANTVPVVVNE
ncbi:hypothetical protein DSCW_04810 [Desulfosarcina widdelii]|uniref:Uncharacterized protein n=1 Tax=Desulfosarcina widdelii TaxID=947919 RepID=A0A5K7Z3L2_9BACT|nr:hypothetical protein DSCW_04810 [Desulfosarcina widdelii]